MSTPDDVLGQLRQARLSAHAIAPLAPQALDRQQGYALLRQTLERRVAAGEKPSGWKVAFAGRGAQARFALDEPVYGGLTDAMQVEPGSAVPLVPCGGAIAGATADAHATLDGVDHSA